MSRSEPGALRRLLRSRRSSFASVLGGGLVAALVAGAAAISTGYPAQRTDLNDGSVWVVNGAERALGRANLEVLELNSVVEASGSQLQVVQSGSRVLLLDRSDNRVEIVDAAVSEVSESVPLPPADPAVAFAGDNVVIHERGTGKVWIVPFARLADFDPADTALLSLGADAVVSVGADGRMFAYRPSAGRLTSIAAAASGELEWETELIVGEPDDAYQITSVGGHWAVLDADTGALAFDGQPVELGELSLPQLQSPSATGDRLLVAHSAGLLQVGLDGEVTPVTEGTTGVPARPVRLPDCAFAAWSGGSAWRDCGDGAAVQLSLAAMPAAPSLEFVVNGDRVVLNDSRRGASWAVQSAGQVIDNWAELIQTETVDDKSQESATDEPAELEKAQVPPVAVDDDFGARPGRASVLPVLLNDYDPNGDVLVIEEVSGMPAESGRLDVIEEGQSLLLTLDSAASGEFTFGYTIGDGRGGRAAARVRVEVRQGEQNSPPAQVRKTTARVHSGGRVTTHVLGDWVDPDGDPIYLTGAFVNEPDRVGFEPEGAVTFTDAGAAGDRKLVTLVVSDGRAEASGSLEIESRPAGQVPIVADPFVVRAYAGEPVRIEPLAHVRGGTGTIRLTGVAQKPGAAISPSYESGTFRFVSDEVRTHYLDYSVSDGEQSATGLVRVDVAAPPDAGITPITIPKTVFVRSLSSKTIDVAGTDIDPGGGVLLVTSVEQLPVSAGVRAEVLDQRAVRVTLTAPLTETVTFGYRVSNGVAEAQGTITVVEIPRPDTLQPPVARDDAATVRVGDVIDIPVLANDEHPDDEELRLLPDLVSGVPSGGGLLFASGTRLRYLAPETPGVYTAVYQIAGPFNQTAQAQVRITVKEVDELTNKPPVPRTVTARVLAGEIVPIEIPLAGIDPDGDSVQLIGQETSPEKGAVVAVGSNTIEYQAGSYSTGTDTFTYTVVDNLGARATGTVRVGIAPRLDGTRNPVAVEDEVRVRPGQAVTVQVLANDSDPDGSALRVSSLEPGDDRVVAEILNDRLVRVLPPAEAGRYGLVYTIENEFGASSSNFVTVIVDPDAPLAHPVAQDTRLGLSDILDRETIDVDVLRNVFFAEGDVSELGLAVLPGYSENAQVMPDRRIRVTIEDFSQILPFVLTHPQDETIRSYAFIWVPGFDDALPQIDRTAPPLSVVSEEPLTIDINDYVIAAEGKTVRLTDSSTVRATHANGEDLVVDDTTLRFVSADRYFGPASISFEVTDGVSADDPEGREATIVLPIQVAPRQNQPPVFLGGVIEFEPAQEKQIDLVKLTNYPYADDVDELAYRMIEPLPEGFRASVEGQTLTLRADEDAVKGTRTALTLGVRDGVNEGQSGRIELRVLPSTRPLARPAPDRALTRRGQTTVIDVLGNDQATNPFPGTPLRVVGISGIDGASLPAGVTVSPSADGSRLTVTVADTAEPVDTNLQYRVADATNDPDRYVWGSVTISVQDVPDAPIAPERQGGFVGGELTIRIAEPSANNSPITGYRVTSTSNGSDYSHDCGLQTICTLPGLQTAKRYRFQVTAVNAIGSSEPSPLSQPLGVDYLPDAPGSLSAVPVADDPAGGALKIDWTAPSVPSGGSAIADYVVTVAGQSFPVPASTTTFSTYGRISLAGGTAVQVQVHARNSAQAGSSDWLRASTTVTTIGPPAAPPNAKAAVDLATGDVTITWAASNPNGAGGVTYSVGRITGDGVAEACTPEHKPHLVSPASVGSGWVDTDTQVAGTYTYFVYADNGLFCRGSTVHVQTPPGPASGTLSVAHSGAGQFDIFVGSLSASPAPASQWYYQYQLGSSGWRDVPENGRLTSLADASVYGTEVPVQLRACRAAGGSVCGQPASAGTAVPVNARVAQATCVPGAPLQIVAPANGYVDSVTYRVSYGSLSSWSAFQAYDPAAAVASDVDGVRIKATVTVGAQVFEDPDFAQFGCGG